MPHDSASTVARSLHFARRLPPTWEVWKGFPVTILSRDRLARAEPPVASATNFADYQKKRRLDLIKAEEEKEQSIQDDETLCPYYTWEWSDGNEGPRRFHPALIPGIYDKYLFRGPYRSDCVWNLADNISPRG